MPTHPTPESLARAWIEGWNAGQPDEIPLSEDFTHSSPFGTVSGRKKYLDWVKPMAAENVSDLRIVDTIGGEGKAVVRFDMMTKHGLIPCCDWVETRGGEIVAVTSFYDATALRE